jgi:hypothetical protein
MFLVQLELTCYLDRSIIVTGAQTFGVWGRLHPTSFPFITSKQVVVFMREMSKTIYSDQSPCLDRRNLDMNQVSKPRTEASTSYSANMEQSRAPIACFRQQPRSRLPVCVPCFQAGNL